MEFIYYGCKVEPVRPYGSTCSSYPGTSTTTSGFTPRRSPPNSDTEEDYFPLIRRGWSLLIIEVNEEIELVLDKIEFLLRAHSLLGVT